jgi:hypothetical protein
MMQTNSAVLAWLSRRPDPLVGDHLMGLHSAPPNPREPLLEVFVLRAIFVGGVSRAVGDKVVMQASDAHALAGTVPATIAFNK